MFFFFHFSSFAFDPWCPAGPPWQLGPPAPLPAHLPLPWGAAHATAPGWAQYGNTYQPVIPQSRDKETATRVEREYEQRLDKAYAHV